MDYLQRDSYFCGVNYGRVEVDWITSNLTYHQQEDQVYLALKHRALYSFDHFFISRHHMYLTVYFHHNSWAYEEMFLRYMESDQCTFRLPSDMKAYLKCDDYLLQQHLKDSENKWAKLIVQRNPYKMLYEVYATERTDETENIKSLLNQKGIACFHSRSQDRVSKYQIPSSSKDGFHIFVVNSRNPRKTVLLDKATQIFHQYQDVRRIERIYVQPDQFQEAQSLLSLPSK